MPYVSDDDARRPGELATALITAWHGTDREAADLAMKACLADPDTAAGVLVWFAQSLPEALAADAYDDPFDAIRYAAVTWAHLYEMREERGKLERRWRWGNDDDK
jgi:hypothetical protein